VPKILFSKASPYAAKARMAAVFAGYAFESVQTDTWTPDEAFLRSNPLGKVPVLVTDDGQSICDSRVIVLFLDRLSGGKLFPADPVARLAAEQLEALADGISDCLQAIMSERRFRPDDKKHAPWTDWQWSKVERALDRLESDPPDLGKGLHAGHIALRAMFGYLGVRFEGQWEATRPRLVDWLDRFDRDYPHFAEVLPRAPET